MINNAYSYRQAPSRNREGAIYKDFWKIYYLLPDNSFVDLVFLNSLNGKCLEKISFSKDGSCTPGICVSHFENQILEAFRKYGYENFNLSLQWRKGFGNSVSIVIAIDREEHRK